LNARAGFVALPEAPAAEQIVGIREDLPPGERVLWQGAPGWRLLARHALHVRAVAVYFALLLAWRAGGSLFAGAGAGQALVDCAPLLGVAAFVLATLHGIAWLSARTTIYAITTRRVVMRIGIALPIFVNLPFRGIESARLGTTGAARGNLALQLRGDVRLAWVHLWPHVRPWRVRRPEPTLRALHDAPEVAAILAAALTQHAALEAARETAQETSHAAAPAATRPIAPSAAFEPHGQRASAAPLAA
jgi:hypothetical protein